MSGEDSPDDGDVYNPIQTKHEIVEMTIGALIIILFAPGLTTIQKVLGSILAIVTGYGLVTGFDAAFRRFSRWRSS